MSLLGKSTLQTLNIEDIFIKFTGHPMNWTNMMSSKSQVHLRKTGYFISKLFFLNRPVFAKEALDSKCLTESIVYKATVTVSDGDVRTYTGLTKSKFKDRLYEHNTDANNSNNCTFTKLAGYVRQKKDQSVNITNYKWEILRKCSTYQPGQRKCDLCPTEKMMIMKNRDPRTLNKRSELMNSCRHRWPYRLDRVRCKPDERRQ